MSEKKKIIDTPLGVTAPEETKVEAVAEETPQEEVKLTAGQQRMLKSMRRRNIILGSIFGVGAITLSAVFFFGTNQSANIQLSSVSDVINPDRQVSTYDSEWFANAVDIVLDTNQVAYFTNNNLHHIYKLENGSVTVFAGNGENTFEDGEALEASFAGPAGLDIHENFLYVADQNNNKIRKVDLATGVVSTVAGAGNQSYEPGALVNGNVNEARFNFPSALVVDQDGTIYVVDSRNNAIRKISGETVTTLAGGNSGDVDGAGSAARFNNPKSIAILDEELLLVADTGNNKLKTVNKLTGAVTTYAGSGGIDLKDGTLLQASFFSPSDVLVTAAGNIFVADTFNHAIRVIPRSSDSVYILTGNGEAGFKDGPMPEAMFSSPISIVEERSGAILVVDSGNKTIRRLQ